MLFSMSSNLTLSSQQAQFSMTLSVWCPHGRVKIWEMSAASGCESFGLPLWVCFALVRPPSASLEELADSGLFGAVMVSGSSDGCVACFLALCLSSSMDLSSSTSCRLSSALRSSCFPGVQEPLESVSFPVTVGGGLRLLPVPVVVPSLSAVLFLWGGGRPCSSFCRKRQLCKH